MYAPGVKYIRSQKKSAQLVYRGYIYNKKQTQRNGHTTWRCSDISKNKCKAVCLTKQSAFVVARRVHHHEPHWDRIANRMLFDVENDLDEYVEINPQDPVQMKELDNMMRMKEDRFVLNYGPRKTFGAATKH